MESLGEFLEKERKARGITLRDIAQESKVRIHYLRLLEGNELNKLPAPIYAKGYLQSYCDYLGLDKEEAFSRYSRQVFPLKPKEKGKEEKALFTKQKILIGTLVVSIFIAVLIII